MSFSLDVNVTGQIANNIRNIRNKLNKLPQEAYKEFVDNTPVRTGNARSKTKLNGKKIEANYSYAGILDKGRHMTTRGMRGSEQAPQGMSRPTLDFIKKRIKQILRGK